MSTPPQQLKWMIAISTAQSQINYIPFVKYKIDRLLLLETPFAKEMWSKGLKELLAEKCVTLDLTDDEEFDILKIVKKVNAELKKPHYKQVELWINFGGGQKHHSIALWQVFTGRQKSGALAVYADQTSRQIMRWLHNDKGELVNESTDRFEILLPIKDVLILYDRIQHPNPRTRLITAQGAAFMRKELYSKWREENTISWLLSTRASKEKDDLEFFERSGFTIDKRREWISSQHKLLKSKHSEIESYLISKWKGEELTSHLVKEIRGICFREAINLISSGVLGENIRKFTGTGGDERKSEQSNLLVTQEYKQNRGDFFENLVQQIFQDKMTHYEGRHLLHEVYANYYTAPAKDIATIEAEYDVLFSTRNGRLYAIDAKTLSFDKKDANARLHIMQQTAGVYIRFIVVLPYFRTETFHSMMRDKLKDFPFDLTKMKIPFYVISEDDHEFMVYKTKRQISLEKPSGKAEEPYESVRCIPFQHFFEKEGLLANIPNRSQGATPNR